MDTAQNVCTCTQCRVSSPLCSAFQRIGRGKKQRILCPSCVYEEAQRQSQMRLIGFAFFLMLGSSVAALGKTTNPGWLLINLALITLMAWLTILPHEAGHAFVAKLVGLDVDRIVLGIGRKLGTFMCFKVPIEVHLYPAGGLTLLEIRELPHFRWKFAAVTLAGPIVDILLLWAAITWGETAWRAERIEGGFAPVCALIAALCLGIVFNLWPMSVGTSAGSTANDGARLLSLPSWMPLPEIVPESDGEIAIEWDQSPTEIFSISIGEQSAIHFAGLFGKDKERHGVEPFEGIISEELLYYIEQFLRRQTGSASAP